MTARFLDPSRRGMVSTPPGSDCSDLISIKLIDLPCTAVLSLITVSHDTEVVCVLLFA